MLFLAFYFRSQCRECARGKTSITDPEQSCTAVDCCNSDTAARSCHPGFFISCCLTPVACKTEKPSQSATLCKPFCRAVGIGHWHRYIQVHVHYISVYIDMSYRHTCARGHGRERLILDVETSLPSSVL